MQECGNRQKDEVNIQPAVTCTSTNLSAETEPSSDVYQEESSRWFGILHLFHFRDVADEGNVVHKVVELLQLTQVLHVILPDGLTEAKKNDFYATSSSLSHER